MSAIAPLRRNITLLILLNWCWVIGSALVVVTPVVEQNDVYQTISHLTFPPQIPTAGHEAVRLAVAYEVASGNGFQVPERVGDGPDVVILPGAHQGETGRRLPRFSPLYGLLLGALTKVTALMVNGGVVDGSLAGLIVYRVLTLVPALLAVTLFTWFFGHSVDLRGLHDRRWWMLMIPVTLLSPLALRATYLNEHALAAALCWMGLAFLNTALFRVAKDQPTHTPALIAGVCLMLAAGLVPLALAVALGFGGVLLTNAQTPLSKIGRSLAIGCGISAVPVVVAHMWGFNKLLPMLAYSNPNIGGAVKDVLTDLVGLNGLLLMFPPAALGLIVLVTRILRTQELEEKGKVDLFRSGQGAFHWGAYWSFLAAIGLAVVDGAFFYGVPTLAKDVGLGVLIHFDGARVPVSFFRYHFGGDGWIVLLPLALYYCCFLFREPVLERWQPWYHNLVRVGALVWLFGCAQPAGGLVCPLVEAIFRWTMGVASYYPLGRIQ